MRSLQFRLGLGLFISLLFTFIILWLLVSQASRFLAEEYITTRLEHDSESLLTALNLDKSSNLTLDSSNINTIYKRPFSGHYYTIVAKDILLRSRSLWDQKLAIETLPIGNLQRKYIEGPQQQPLLAVSKAYKKYGQHITIAVAEDLTTIDTQLNSLQIYFFTFVSVILLVLVAIQIWILYTGLRPLDKTRQELHDLSQGKLTQLNTRVPKEILPLVEEINYLLRVMEQRLQRSRNAIGDLAHALKKPLTVLNQQLSDKTIKNDPVLYNLLSEHLDNIQNHINRILHRARLAGEGPIAKQFNANEDIPLLITTLQGIYHNKELSFIYQIPDNLKISVDREDMLELIGNLLDNACKWAASTVKINFNINQHIEINIEDDGPGVDANKAVNLTQRGLRLDEKVDGYGLGLSIVSDIVNNHNGQLTLQQSKELGGLHATVRLPL